jgi:hypothetical protein
MENQLLANKRDAVVDHQALIIALVCISSLSLPLARQFTPLFRIRSIIVSSYLSVYFDSRPQLNSVGLMQ